MKKYFCIVVVNNTKFFFWDTYQNYIVNADSIESAKEKCLQGIPHIQSVDEAKEINSDKANALMEINYTRKVNDSITFLNSY